MNHKTDYLLVNEIFEPRAPDMEKVKHYVNVDSAGLEMQAHERDIYMPDPLVLKPPA